MQKEINWHDWFVYDEASPSCLRNKVQRGRKAAKGRMAGWQDDDGYWVVQLNDQNYRCHRIIFEMLVRPLKEDEEVDHRDGDTRNARVGNLRAVPHPVNVRNMGRSKRNKSGETGVRFNDSRSNLYWTASWRTLEGQSKSKHFSIQKHGLLPAFAMAVTHRRAMIEQLNQQGAGYTERHGT